MRAPQEALLGSEVSAGFHGDPGVRSCHGSPSGPV